MLRKFSAYASCAHRLQIADHLRQIQRRIRIDQQMHVIGFAAELDEAAAPLFKDLEMNNAGIQDKASLVVCGRLFLKLPGPLFGLGLMDEFGSPAFRSGLLEFVEANRTWVEEVCSVGDAGRASSITEAGFALSEDDLDEDGYPTDAACLKLEKWPWEDIRGWLAYARSLWHHAEYGWHETTEAHASKPGELSINRARQPSVPGASRGLPKSRY